ncbi:MAG: hypothetical protein GY807_23930 [Gammaproteobacteria bacterium]|nr:hypothetical protein [Gammaproteobacteria bacterium]
MVLNGAMEHLLGNYGEITVILLGTGREDQMDIIRNDAVLGEQVSVECVVVFLDKNPLTTVIPLRDMVGNTGNGDSGKTSL